MTQVAAITQPVWQKPESKEQKLQRWLDAQAALAQAKEVENAARKEVVAAYPFDHDKKEGTQTIELANGYKLKVVLKQNYNLDKDATDEALDTLEKIGEDGKFIAERLVKWKPDLSLTEYRLLKPEHKAVIDKVLTITEGTPALELVEPKAKK